MSDPETTPEPPMSEPPQSELEPPVSEAAIDTDMVRRLADILNDTDLTEIEVGRGDLKIRVTRQAAAAPIVHAVQPAGPAPSAVAAPVPAQMSVSAPAAQAAPERTGEVVTSPMVGTAYLQAQPGAQPFVRVGDRVSEGQTLLVVEAMKTMNPIPAPRAGVITEFLIEDAQPVEFGEPLCVID